MEQKYLLKAEQRLSGILNRLEDTNNPLSHADRKTAERVVQETLQNKKEKIMRWYGKGKLRLTQHFQQNVGRGITDKAQFVHDQKIARTVLIKDDYGNIKILTSFPVDPR